MPAVTQPLKTTPDTPAAHLASPQVAAAEIHIKGRHLAVPSVQIEGRTIITTGRWLKMAAARHEELLEGETVTDPPTFITQLKKSGLDADIFTFAQRLPDIVPKYAYWTEWETAAALPITTYAEWLKHGAEYSIRKAVNRAQRAGVVTGVAEFNDDFVRATLPIYNELSVRQGRAFWHYGKDFETIKRELGDYLDRSIFIGAYFQGELIGFIKLAWVGATATITQILSMRRHFDKRPNNALIAKAIEMCESRGKSHFIYGDFIYFDPNSSLTEFKRRIGFQPVPLPRYFIPLTLKGKIALMLRLHRPLAAKIPKPLLSRLLKLRRNWSQRKLSANTQTDNPKTNNEPV